MIQITKQIKLFIQAYRKLLFIFEAETSDDLTTTSRGYQKKKKKNNLHKKNTATASRSYGLG